jgi:hypothetical protein
MEQDHTARADVRPDKSWLMECGREGEDYDNDVWEERVDFLHLL